MAVIPRRLTMVEDNIPLFLIPDIIKRGIHNYGEEVEWIMVKLASHHFYTVRIRTRPVRREYRHRVAVPADEVAE
ncbi:MAG: hypothetical protein Q7T80_15245 [Methanoregula sp.]|nr:hypothetical protein [Methanoregula sp.]